MAFKRPLPEWNNPGIEPPQSKKDMGWLGREKPPAQWHNWFQHLVFKALEELQQGAAHVTFGATAPTSPDVNDLWVDTSGLPVLVLKTWDGTQWITVGAVNSVNGKTGNVELTAADVGAASLTAFNEHLNDFAQVWAHRIVEMGTNINGTYVRLESGLQICFGRPIVFTGDGTTDVKSGTIAYPASFDEPPTLIGKSQGVASTGDMDLLWEIYVYGGSISTARWVAMRRAAFWVEETSYRANYLAIGRWK